jgi:hypothetical protein
VVLGGVGEGAGVSPPPPPPQAHTGDDFKLIGTTKYE